MRRFGLLVMTALLTTATAAAAQPRAARATKVVRGTHPTLDPAAAAILADAKAFVKSSERKEAVSTVTVLQEYQRVGRALLLLENERREQTGAESLDAELQMAFRSIKLDDAIATPERRAETAKVLDELRSKIDRLRGIAMTHD
jgi:hypothetical protein